MITVPYEVKRALRDGRYKKNYRILVLNDDGTEDFTIDNENLVYESVEIDERLCSGDELKFGLCEGSSLEFQYFGLGNIYGRALQVFIDVYTSNGTYKQIGTLEANGPKYVSQKEQRYYVVMPPNTSGNLKLEANGAVYSKSWSLSSNPTTLYFNPLVGEKLYITSSYSFTAPINIINEPYSIPMGFFYVSKCARQASTGIMKVTAYNKLISEYLDQKANLLIQGMYSDPDIPVHVIDIESLLLSRFGIREEQREQVPLAALSDESWYHPLTTGIKANTKYGVNTPLSYFELGSTTNTRYLWISSESPYFNLDPTKPYRVSFEKDFEAYERSTYTFLYDLFDNASLDKTASTIMADFMTTHTAGGYTYKGFQSVIGVDLVKPDDSIESYSTIGYENHCTGVVGTWSDLSKKVIVGYKKIVVHLPKYLDIMTSSSNPNQQYLQASIDLWGYAHQYIYYTDSSWNTAYGYYSFPKYSDDTYVKLDDLATAVFFHTDRITNLSDAELIEITPSDIPDVTLRELQSASFETVCQFGQLSRITDLFSGVELNQGGLYPADTLYPSDTLYPRGAALSASQSMYSKLWADEGNVRKWRNLVITFKGLDQEQNETDFELTVEVNADGTDDYIMSDNWLFRNLVWTAEQVADYADAMVAKMQDVTWFPFEMWCVGLPYLETGDEIEIPLNGTVYTSYVLQRQLKGIQNLQDTYINGTLDIF